MREDMNHFIDVYNQPLMNQSSLISNDAVDQAHSFKPSSKISKKCIGIILIVAIISVSVTVGLLLLIKSEAHSALVEPIEVRIALPNLNPFKILLGNSRVIEVLFYSGFDNRASDDYKTVTQRSVVWETNPKGIVSIDPYGRLETLSLGLTTVRVQSKSSPNVYAELSIEVIKSSVFSNTQKRVIDYGGGHRATLNKVMQKIVSYKSKAEALESAQVPQSIKDIINDHQKEPTKQIIQQNGAVWKIEDYADGSNRSFIKRVNANEIHERDRIMHLIGDRYLPGSGLSVISIQDDQALGIWTVNSEGEVSHIEMKSVGYKEKAETMVKNTQESVLRHGVASSADLVNGKWVPGYTDNDGLWTSVYAAGQFMRLASLRTLKYPEDQISVARNSSLHSLKAILLIANIPCRNITIDAKIRHFINTRAGSGQKLSQEVLAENQSYAVQQYVGSPAYGFGFYGTDAGKTIDGAYYGGTYKYSFSAIDNEVWKKLNETKPANSKRTLNGFIARTFLIQSLDGVPTNGLFYRHNKDGTHYVLQQADRLYDYGANQHPTLNLGTMDLPQILKDFLNINGVQYQKSDLLYKGDTSTDEVIGHLFIYKIAYDILDEADQEQRTLKELIRSTMVNLCTCFINNGYNMVDATGQGTSWAKLTRTFMNSDYTLEDSPIKALQLLMSFKLCYYVTDDQSWQKQYQFLIEDQSFRYLDLVAIVWKRWTYRTYNQDSFSDYNIYHLDPKVAYSQVQQTRHIMESLHYSDEEQAMLGYYLAFQLQTREEYLALYRQGLKGWWHSISRSENSLWYYIYQLAYPNEAKVDYYGNNILDVAAWRLSRHPIDTRTTAAFIEGSRDDVIMEGQQRVVTLSRDPKHVLQRRLHASDAKFNERAINYKVSKGYDPMNIYEFKVLPPDECRIHRFNGATFQRIDEASSNYMLPSTSYTLPFWMGVYHKMLPIQ